MVFNNICLNIIDIPYKDEGKEEISMKNLSFLISITFTLHLIYWYIGIWLVYNDIRMVLPSVCQLLFASETHVPYKYKISRGKA
jgi:hypothetical protein